MERQEGRWQKGPLPWETGLARWGPLRRAGVGLRPGLEPSLLWISQVHNLSDPLVYTTGPGEFVLSASWQDTRGWGGVPGLLAMSGVS